MKYQFKRPEDAYIESQRYNEAGKVAPFPPYVTFQLNNSCNFRCRMCTLAYASQPEGFMDLDLFNKCIDEVASYGSLVRFIGWNENFLYPDLLEAIRYVKQSGLLVHITTNGSLLTREAAEAMIEAGVDSVIFSFQGLTPEEDMFMRRIGPKVYDRIIDNIKMLFALKQGRKPFVKITTTVSHRDDLGREEAFIAEHSDYADLVQVSGFTHFGHLEAAFNQDSVWSFFGVPQPAFKNGVACHLPNYEMLIKPDGSVSPCCGAFSAEMTIGNVHDSGLAEIWQSGRADEIRRLLASGELDSFTDCATCGVRYDYEGLQNPIPAFKDA